MQVEDMSEEFENNKEEMIILNFKENNFASDKNPERKFCS